ncbi:phosphotransferase family protein [Rhodococcus sp. NPDC127528]|uniref:phosphotransferase family protein n=1 Tax=unclassified Rhodococcus (in: high G+C Gram-positive bacteria) TaxID=192944 RepID=UPI00363F2F68
MTGIHDNTETRAGRVLDDTEAAELTRWLAGRLPGAGEVGIVPLAQAAGHSHEIHLVTRGDRRWVLRVAPDHPEAAVGGAFDLSREARILAALSGTGIAHPAVVLARDDTTPLRRDLLVTEFVDGITLDRALPPQFANARDGRAITESIVDTLARINTLDWAATGLAALTRPDGYLGRQFDKARVMLEQFRTRDTPALDTLLGRLEARQPREYRLGLIHGDYSAMNLMVDRAEPAVCAVLDWETATVGDAMVDIGYLTARWVRPDENPMVAAFALGGTDPRAHDLVPGRRHLVDRFAERTGWSVDLLPFYQGLAMARLAVVLEGRVATSKRRRRDDAATMFTALADGCADHGLRLADG